MSDEPTNQRPRRKWSCCLFAGLSFLAVAILVIVAGWLSREWARNRELADRQDRWERQIADVKAGKTTRILWPEPRFLEDFVKNQPEVAAKITEVSFDIGKVSDERFGYVASCPI